LGFLGKFIMLVLEFGKLFHMVGQNDVGLTINTSITIAEHDG
jgi:hypothetical protein